MAGGGEWLVGKFEIWTEEGSRLVLRPPGFATAGRPRPPSPHEQHSSPHGPIPVNTYCALKNRAASGGRVSFREKGRPWVGISSAWTPPMLPMPLPAYSRASLLSISRQ